MRVEPTETTPHPDLCAGKSETADLHETLLEERLVFSSDRREKLPLAQLRLRVCGTEKRFDGTAEVTALPPNDPDIACRFSSVDIIVILRLTCRDTRAARLRESGIRAGRKLLL